MILEFAEISANFIEVYILFNFMQILCEGNNKLKMKSKISIAILISIMLYVLNSLQLFSYITSFIWMVLILIFSRLVCKGGFMQRFTVLVVFMLLLLFLDFFFIVVLGLFFNDINYINSVISHKGNLRFINLLVVKSIMIITYLIIKKIIKDKKVLDVRYCKWIIMINILMFIIQAFSFDAILSDSINELKIAISLTWILIFSIICLAIYIFYLFSKNALEKQHYNLVSLKNDLLDKNYSELHNLYMQNAQNFHDFNNHLSVVHKLINEGNFDSATEYVEKINNKTAEIYNVIQTGVDVVDAVINIKLQEAAKYNIKIDYNIEFPKYTNIESADICSILSNLLDNAIEACIEITEIEERVIHIAIKNINQFIIIKIENTVIKNPFSDNKKLNTKKSNTVLHGWGLKSVENTITKYDGSIKQYYDKEMFITVASLCYKMIFP